MAEVRAVSNVMKVLALQSREMTEKERKNLKQKAATFGWSGWVYPVKADIFFAKQKKGDNMSKACCYDCGLPYGQNGWIEAIIPDKIWNKIQPDGCADGGGILCILCISKRLDQIGLKGVPVWLTGTEPLKAMLGSPGENINTLRDWDVPTKAATPGAVFCIHIDNEDASCNAGKGSGAGGGAGKTDEAGGIGGVGGEGYIIVEWFE